MYAPAANATKSEQNELSLLVTGLSASTPYSFTVTAYGNNDTEIVTFTGDFTTTATATFIAVANITGVPTTATAGIPLTITNTVEPSNATNQTIIWSISPNNTLSGVSVNGNTFNTTIAGTAKVRATITNGLTATSNYTQDFDITVTDETGINDILANQLTIFPNPAKDEIFIKSEFSIKKVEIYSLTGSLLFLENNFNGKISVSALPQSVYLLKIYTDKGVAISKIVKE